MADDQELWDLIDRSLGGGAAPSGNPTLDAFRRAEDKAKADREARENQTKEQRRLEAERDKAHRRFGRLGAAG